LKTELHGLDLPSHFPEGLEGDANRVEEDPGDVRSLARRELERPIRPDHALEREGARRSRPPGRKSPRPVERRGRANRSRGLRTLRCWAKR